MSCQHGNHVDACDLCDEVNDSYKAGLAEGMRQQAEQAGWAISDEPTLEMCQAMMRAQDESDGEGPREVEMRDMYVAAKQAAPLLRAPTEQDVRVDEEMSIDLALGYAKAACIGPMSSQAIAVIESALAQNAQGEAVEWQSRFISIQGGWSPWRNISKAEYESMLSNTAVQMGSTQLRALYLHAERTRVPDVDAVVSRFLGWRLPADFAPDGGVSFNPPSNPLLWPTGTCLLNDPQATAMFEYLLAAVPSQPEDAA